MEHEGAKKVDLQEKNSRVLLILPSLLSGLLRRRRFVDRVYEYIDEVLKRGEDESLVKLRKSIEKADEEGKFWEKEDVSVDPSKTIMLTYLFGDMYTKALGLATGGNIQAEVYSVEELEKEEIQRIVKNHFTGKLEPGTQPVFLRVYEDTLAQPVAEKEANHWLEIRRLLAKIGASVDLNTKLLEMLENLEHSTETERIWPLGKTVCVNLYNWFCSNSEFLKALADKKNETPIEQVLEGYERNSENDLLFEILLKRLPRPQIDPIPMCAELLAVLIAAYNYESIPINIQRITETWQVLEAAGIR